MFIKLIRAVRIHDITMNLQIVRDKINEASS